MEILESIPVQKNFIKEQLINSGLSHKIREIVDFLLRTSLLDLSDENLIKKYKLTNMYSLKFINALVKNHPYSQRLIHECGLVDLLYRLTQAKHSDK